MNQDLSSNWTSTTSDSQGGAQGSSGAGDDDAIFDDPPSDDEKLFAPPAKKTSGKVPIRRQGRMMSVAFGAALALAGVFMLVVIFVQGVNFLQASLTDVPLPSLVAQDVDNGGGYSSLEDESPVTGQVTSDELTSDIINIGDSVQDTQQAAAWPSFIKINRFTVGSPMVPDFSRAVSIPINSVRDARQIVHSAADKGNLDQVRRPPETGPAMWVMVLLCLAVVPVFFLRGAKSR